MIKLKSEISFLNLQGCKQDVPVVQRQRGGKEGKRGQAFWAGLMRGTSCNPCSCSPPASSRRDMTGLQMEGAGRDSEREVGACLPASPSHFPGGGPDRHNLPQSHLFPWAERCPGMYAGAFMETFKQVSPAQPQHPAHRDLTYLLGYCSFVGLPTVQMPLRNCYLELFSFIYLASALRCTLRVQS